MLNSIYFTVSRLEQYMTVLTMAFTRIYTFEFFAISFLFSGMIFLLIFTYCIGMFALKEIAMK